MNNQSHILTDVITSVNRPPLVTIGKDHISYDLNVLSFPNPSTLFSEHISYHLKQSNEILSLIKKFGPMKEPKDVLDRYVQNKELSPGQQVDLDRWFHHSTLKGWKLIEYIQRSPVYQYMNICSDTIHMTHDSIECNRNECHYNSRFIAIEDNLRYGLVEGFVLRLGVDGDVSLFPHSWNIDRFGNYVDFTPSVYEDNTVVELYVGLHIPTQFFASSFMKLMGDTSLSLLLPYINVFPRPSLQ